MEVVLAVVVLAVALRESPSGEEVLRVPLVVWFLLAVVQVLVPGYRWRPPYSGSGCRPESYYLW